MLFLLPKDILRNILQTYLNDKEANNLFRTCKTIYNIDYLRFLQNKNYDIWYFSLVFAKHYTSLNSIFIKGVSEPELWLSYKWPRKVEFLNCYHSKIDPCNITDTEELIINQKQSYNKKIKINWYMFPKLKKIQIQTYDIDISGIYNCKNLEHIYLISHQSNIVLSKDIYNIKNLKYLFTNCFLEDIENMIFISEKIEQCIVNNNYYKNIIRFNNCEKYFSIEKCYCIEQYYSAFIQK
jgi:hypothetical protein